MRSNPHSRCKFTQYNTALYIAGAVLYCVVFFKNAWVGDDAYILFRSLDQLLDGNGPRWNPHERVQVFTCPLWYGLLAIAGLLSRDHYLNCLLLSMFCNGLLLWNLARILPNARNWLWAVVVLVFSQAYFDFTSSGLENPLAYCLLSFIARFYLNKENQPNAQATRSLLIASSLLLITRHDLALFVLPLLLQTFYLTKRESGTRKLFAQLVLLLAPLVAWSLFSLLYYGFLFPNTAYAKLASVVPHSELLQRGWLYFTTSILRDFISIAVLVVGVVIGCINKNARLRLLAAGIVLHLLYVFWIGGDFMRGRFFSWDFLLCIIIIFYSPFTQATLWRTWINVRALTIGFALLFTTMLWEPPVITPLDWGAKPFAQPDSINGITQERHFYFWFTSLYRYLEKGNTLLLNHGWCQDSIEQQRQNLHVTAANTMGFRGYCLGTQDIVVDMLGITDPLLARMPKNPTHTNWRPGHFHRLLPSGYCASIADGTNHINDPLLHNFYDTMRLLTQSSTLFSTERLRAIWDINTGVYSQTIEKIQQALLNQYQTTDGNAWQTAARKECPLIELQPDVIEKLKHVGEGE